MTLVGFGVRDCNDYVVFEWPVIGRMAISL